MFNGPRISRKESLKGKLFTALALEIIFIITDYYKYIYRWRERKKEKNCNLETNLMVKRTNKQSRKNMKES